MVIKKYLTKKNFNTANKKNKYILIHYTGNNVILLGVNKRKDSLA